MKAGWKEKSVGEILQLVYGKPLDDADRKYDGLYPVYGANGEKSRSDKFYFDKPSIIIGRKGSAGELNITEDKFWPLDVTYFVTFDEHHYDLQFLYYLLSTLDLPSLAKGVKPGINRNEVYSQRVTVPPLSEQQRIVNILDEAFACISTAKANAEKNLQNARALFERVLNSAVTGELTRDWRHNNPDTDSASEDLKQALTKCRSKSKNIEPQPPVLNKPIDIPTSWTLASPEQLSTHIIDCPHSTPKWTDSGEVCLRTTNFKSGFLDLESVRFVSDETYDERIMRLEPKPGDVLYSREGGILGIACIFPDGLKACLGQRMMQFRLNVDLVFPQYFTCVLNSDLILSEVRRLTGGAAAPHLNIRDIRTFPIPLPPIKEQLEIVNNLETVSAETQRLEFIYQQKLAAIDALKKSLLDQAFTGGL